MKVAVFLTAVFWSRRDRAKKAMQYAHNVQEPDEPAILGKEGVMAVKMMHAFASFAFGMALTVSAQNVMAADPVSMLIQVEGKVEHSRDGEKWRDVRRNKLLFEGDHVKTGADGKGTLIDQASGMSQALAAGSQVQISGGAAKVVAGSIGESQAASGDLMAGIGNRFTTAQRYTTVRRSVNKPGEELKLRTAKDVTLSATYPTMAWENVGDQYTYVIEIDGKAHDVPAVKDGIVTFKVPALTAGNHEYMVKVMEGGKQVAEAEKAGTITFLSDAKDKEVAEEVAKLKAIVGDDKFMIGNLLDSKGLTVAAMENFRLHFADFKEDNEMRPLLIKAYNDLKLNELKKAEALVYNEMLNQN